MNVKKTSPINISDLARYFIIKLPKLDLLGLNALIFYTFAKYYLDKNKFWKKLFLGERVLFNPHITIAKPGILFTDIYKQLPNNELEQKNLLPYFKGNIRQIRNNRKIKKLLDKIIEDYKSTHHPFLLKEVYIRIVWSSIKTKKIKDINKEIMIDFFVIYIHFCFLYKTGELTENLQNLLLNEIK
ncbi:MAG: hypothetical protein QFY14_01255 [Candidatus Phytoplasma pruni]|nr:hypothetical protein [Candidatus Phytoplasma pruni]